MSKQYLFQDTLKTFDDIKTSKKKYEIMLFDIQKNIYSESVINTLYFEIKRKC